METLIVYLKDEETALYGVDFLEVTTPQGRTYCFEVEGTVQDCVRKLGGKTYPCILVDGYFYDDDYEQEKKIPESSNAVVSAIQFYDYDEDKEIMYSGDEIGDILVTAKLKLIRGRG